MQLNSHNQIYKKRTSSTITTTLLSDIKSSLTPPSTFCETILSDLFSIITHLTTFISQFQLLSRKNLKADTLITRTKTTMTTELTSFLNKIHSTLNKSSPSQFEITTQHTFTLTKPVFPLTSNANANPNPIDYQELLNENIIDRIKAKIMNSYKTQTHLRNHNKSINNYYHYNSTNNALSNSTNIISPYKSTKTSKRNHKRGIRYYTVSRKHNGLYDNKKMNTVNYSYNNKLLSFSMSRDKEDYTNNMFSISNSMFHNSNNQTFVTFDDAKIYQTLAGSGLTITSKGGPKPSTYARNLVNKGRNIIEDYRKKTGRKRSGSGNSYKLNSDKYYYDEDNRPRSAMRWKLKKLYLG